MRTSFSHFFYGLDVSSVLALQDLSQGDTTRVATSRPWDNGPGVLAHGGPGVGFHVGGSRGANAMRVGLRVAGHIVRLLVDTGSGYLPLACCHSITDRRCCNILRSLQPEVSRSHELKKTVRGDVTHASSL